MNTKDFSPEQQDALLDLAVLAMYADGHLASVEDERLHKLLVALGHATEHDRNKRYDASVSRVSRRSQNAETVRQYAGALVKNFATAEQRHQVLKTIDDLLASDSRVAAQESGYLSVIRQAFQV